MIGRDDLQPQTETLVSNLEHEAILGIQFILAHLLYADLPEDDPCLLAF